LLDGESRSGPVEVALARRLDAPQIRPELGDVQVQLEDPPLVERPFEPIGDDRLLELPERVPGRREVEVLGELLGNRARTSKLDLPLPRLAERA
jgi:hypothetical protein